MTLSCYDALEIVGVIIVVVVAVVIIEKVGYQIALEHISSVGNSHMSRDTVICSKSSETKGLIKDRATYVFSATVSRRPSVYTAHRWTNRRRP